MAVIGKRQPKIKESQKLIDEIINKGGKVSAERNEKDQYCFTMRLSKDLIRRIDEAKKSNLMRVSRTQYIIACLEYCLQNDVEFT